MLQHQSIVLPFPTFHPKSQETVGVHKINSALDSRLSSVVYTDSPCFCAMKYIVLEVSMIKEHPKGI